MWRRKKRTDELIKRPEFAESIQRSDSRHNHFILLILDSCRFDTFMEAEPTTILRLGRPEKRFSYASWTAPSHYNLLMGLFPHCNPTRVFASDYYKKDFLQFNKRFDTQNFEFKKLIPNLYLPIFLRDTLGYYTAARVSLPVINPSTILNRGFDSYVLMEKHNDLAGMIETMDFPPDQPSFHLLNIGETHYPYATPKNPPVKLPHLHGVHGVFKHLEDELADSSEQHSTRNFFDAQELIALRERQLKAVKYVDSLIDILLEKIPPNSFLTVTSDHGECFGEGGFFGHGPIMHEKVFEVPFIEGRL
ncbi:sulfatase-like hydrolase/transferase [candidate division KSB1 bacterium]|nr:sulfatase-like hydrolase/transferase [candidate division KSB1 bacterium]